MKAALLIPALAMSSAATAQDVSAQQAPAQSAQQTAEVSDEEVARFALAALMVQQIAEDTATSQEEKQAAMVGALGQAGVAPDRFNEIAKASQADPELNERINAAAAAHIEAAKAAQQSQESQQSQ